MKTSQEDVPYGLVSETTTDSKGNTVEKWYDSLDKIYKVIDGNDVTVYNYYENDKLSSVTVPGGTTTTYTYDSLCRIPLKAIRVTQNYTQKAKPLVTAFSYRECYRRFCFRY